MDTTMLSCIMITVFLIADQVLESSLADPISCRDRLSLAVIVNNHASIEDVNLPIVRQFVKDLVNGWDVDEGRSAVVVASDDGAFLYDFCDKEGVDSALASQKIDLMQLNSDTNVVGAMEALADRVTAIGEDNISPLAVVVFTASKLSSSMAEIEAASANLQEVSSVVLVVAVGGDNDLNQLKAISSLDDIFLTDDFDAAQSIISGSIKQVCGPEPKDEGCQFCCSTKEICKLPKDPGPCDGIEARWYYNKKKGECMKFNYGGCDGNGNRFKSKNKCKRMCDPCFGSAPKPCEPVIPRVCEMVWNPWYFDKNTGKCKKASVAGCHNYCSRNVYESKKACQKKCETKCRWNKKWVTTVCDSNGSNCITGTCKEILDQNATLFEAACKDKKSKVGKKCCKLCKKKGYL